MIRDQRCSSDCPPFEIFESSTSHYSKNWENCAVPEGTRYLIPLYPGLPPWANGTSTPFGVRLTQVRLQQRGQNRAFTFGDKSNFAPCLPQHLAASSAVPEGTRIFSPRYPGLRSAPSWANCTSTPGGVRFLQVRLQQRGQSRVFTLGDRSKFSAPLANFEKSWRGLRTAIAGLEVASLTLSTAGRVRQLDSKPLFFNILPLSPLNGRFCGEFLRLAFCFQYFANGGGRGVGHSSVTSSQLAVVSGQSPVRKGELYHRHPSRDYFLLYSTLKSRRECPAVPTGLDPFFPSYPGLRSAPSWANCTATPAGFHFRSFHSTGGDENGVLAQTLKRWAKLFRPFGARFPAVCFTRRIRPRAATQSRLPGVLPSCYAYLANSEQRRANSVEAATYGG